MLSPFIRFVSSVYSLVPSIENGPTFAGFVRCSPGAFLQSFPQLITSLVALFQFIYGPVTFKSLIFFRISTVTILIWFKFYQFLKIPFKKKVLKASWVILYNLFPENIRIKNSFPLSLICVL